MSNKQTSKINTHAKKQERVMHTQKNYTKQNKAKNKTQAAETAFDRHIFRV